MMSVPHKKRDLTWGNACTAPLVGYRYYGHTRPHTKQETTMRSLAERRDNLSKRHQAFWVRCDEANFAHLPPSQAAILQTAHDLALDMELKILNELHAELHGEAA